MKPAESSTTVPAVVPAIDGLRGVAALLVLLFHAWVYTDAPLGGGALRALVASGGLGVDFFFVISGFVLFLPVARRDGDFGDVRAYALRRVARIVPAYYLSLFLQALLVRPLTGFASPFASPGGWLVLAAHLLFLQHELPTSVARAAGYDGNVVGFGVNGVVWSLSIEALFYAALPLVAAPFFRRPLVGIGVAVATSVAWRWLALLVAPPDLAPTPPRLLEQLPAFPAHFAFGMAAALLFVRTAGGPSSQRAAAATRGAGVAALHLAALGVLGAVMIEHGGLVAAAPAQVFARTVTALGPALAFALLLAIAVCTPRGPLRVLASPAFRWLGDVSYGVFLWHLPLILAARPLVLRATGDQSTASYLLLCLVVVPASLLLGWLSRRFVEEPAIAWARRRTA
jgi:peptidoglycan/LPS O-acetylase OafA/YrhL